MTTSDATGTVAEAENGAIKVPTKNKKNSKCVSLPGDTSRYDKLKPWELVREDICEQLKHSSSDVSIPREMQLLHTLRHPNPLSTITTLRSTTCDVVVTQCSMGSSQQASAWLLTHGTRQLQNMNFTLAAKVRF